MIRSPEMYFSMQLLYLRLSTGYDFNATLVEQLDFVHKCVTLTLQMMYKSTTISPTPTHDLLVYQFPIKWNA